MDRESGRKLAQALLVGAFLCPSGQPLAQENAAPATAASGAAPVEAATQSRKDRRRGPRTDATDKVEAGTDAAATAATAATAEPERVCKNIKPLGTRMAKRVCGTPEQWAALEKKTTDAASDDLRHVRSTGGVIATTPGPASTP